VLEVLGKLLETPGSSQPERIATFRGETVIFRQPDQIRFVLKDRRFVRADLLRLAFGDGIVTSEDKPGSERRKVLARQFGTPFVSRFFENSLEVFAEKLAAWPNGIEVDLARECNRMTLEVICRTAFGRPLGQDFKSIAGAIGLSVASIGPLSGLSVCESPGISPDFQGNLRKIAQAFDSFALPLIRKARSSESKDDNILAALAESSLSEQEVRDEIVSLLVAGSETSALTLSWSLVELHHRPETYHALRREAEAVLGSKPQFEKIGELVKTKAVVEETLRLHPPVWHMVRRASVDIDVLGVPIKAGTDVVVSPYLLHRDKELWESPCSYLTERFLDRKAEREEAYMPFSSGHHICLGRKAALVEVVVLLALFCQQIEVELLDQEFPVLLSSTLRHKNPLRARLTRLC